MHRHRGFIAGSPNSAHPEAKAGCCRDLQKIARTAALDSAWQVCKQSPRHLDGAFFEERTAMSGPIVRTGTTPKFWQNWDQVFGGKKSRSGETKAAGTKSAKSAKKVSKKSATGKKAKKPTAKKK
jgi:hypothetical protein